MFRTDERAQVVQIGAIVLFGFIVVAFSMYQANVVPAEVATTEYEHSQQVQSQLVDLRASLHATADTGNSYPATVSLGTTYQARLVALNPPTSQGRLASYPAPSVSLSNVAAVDGGPDLSAGIEYQTRSLVYRPSYNGYENAPVTRYESTVLYDSYDDGTIARTNQTVLSGDTISLVLLRGALNTTGAGATTLDPTPLSTPRSSTTITGDSASPLTLAVPTEMPRDSWEPLLDPQLQSNGGNLLDYTCTDPETGQSRADTEPCGLLTLELDPDVEYSLEVAAVGVGAPDESVSQASYVVATAGNDTTVTEESRQKVVVQVRDRFNNPVSGITLTADTNNSVNNDAITGTATTDEDGYATLIYTPGDVNGDTRTGAEVYFDGEAPNPDFSSPKNARLAFTVVDTDAGGQPPTVKKFDATNVSNSTYVRFDVDWDVRDNDGDLETVKVTLEDADGNVVDDNTTTVSGRKATQGKSNEEVPDVEVADSDGGTYTVRITVTDAEGNSASESQTFTVDTGSGGGGGGGSPSITYQNAQAIGANNGGVEFDIAVSGAEITVKSVEVVSFDQSQDIKQLRETASGNGPQTNELYIQAATNGWADAGDGNNAFYEINSNNNDIIDLSTDGQEAIITDGGTGTVTLYQFQKSKGKSRDMTGRKFTFKITYVENGNTRTYSGTVTV